MNKNNIINTEIENSHNKNYDIYFFLYLIMIIRKLILI